MSNKNLSLELKARLDSSNKVYYVAKLKAPVLIDAKNGITFLVFISETGEESLQIASMDNKDNYND